MLQPLRDSIVADCAFLQVMKDLRSNSAGAKTDLTKKDIANAVKAKLTSSDSENEDAMIKT